jgi:hypothetical protein
MLRVLVGKLRIHMVMMQVSLTDMVGSLETQGANHDREVKSYLTALV